MSHAINKADKLAAARRLYLLTPQGLTDIALAKALGIDRASAYRYRKELGATEVAESHYTLEPSQDDVAFALAVLQRVNRVPPR